MCTIIGALVVACLTVFAVEFPASKEETKVVSVMANGKLLAEMKIVVPVTIDASGADVSVAKLSGNKTTMKIKDGSVEIKPENGKPVKITGELIYVYGYGKAEKK